MRTMAVVNHKGGSGKTTAAVNLAAALSEQGSILLVDVDPQCSATRWLGYEPPPDQRLSRVLVTGAHLQDLVMPTDISGGGLIPGDEWLEIAERRDFDGAAIPQLALREALEASTITADFVIIDTPGRLSLLSVAALATVDEILVPVPAGAMELEHVLDLQDTISEVRRINPDSEIPT